MHPITRLSIHTRMTDSSQLYLFSVGNVPSPSPHNCRRGFPASQNLPVCFKGKHLAAVGPPHALGNRLRHVSTTDLHYIRRGLLRGCPQPAYRSSLSVSNSNPSRSTRNFTYFYTNMSYYEEETVVESVRRPRQSPYSILSL